MGFTTTGLLQYLTSAAIYYKTKVKCLAEDANTELNE
jgi:hypothetical protein